MKKSKKGFTLIELIVVLAILAVVAAIAVPTAFGAIEKAKVAADNASIDSFNSSIRMQAAIDKTGDDISTIDEALTAAKISGLTKMPQSKETSITVENIDGIATVVRGTGKNDGATDWDALITAAVTAAGFDKVDGTKTAP